MTDLRKVLHHYERETHSSQMRLEIAVKIAQIGTVSLSIGLVFWVMRISNLFLLLIGSLPIWRFYDPLPVLDMTKTKKEWEKKNCKEDQICEKDICLLLDHEKNEMEDEKTI